MDYVNKLRDGRKTHRAALLEFYEDYNQKERVIFCFVEGEDDKIFYKAHSRLLLGLQINVYLYECHSKNGVLAVFELLQSKPMSQNERFGYFIDKDFGPAIQNELIYETPGYSIENFFSHSSTVQTILEDIFHVRKNSNDLRNFLSLFTALQEEFHIKICLLNAWLACQSDTRRDGKQEKLNVESITEPVFKQIVKNDLSGIHPISEIDSLVAIANLFGVYNINDDVMQKKLIDFQDKDVGQLFYGKLELKFLGSFLIQFKNVVGEKWNGSERIYKTKFQFQGNFLIGQLSSYVPAPEGLCAYFIALKKALNRH